VRPTQIIQTARNMGVDEKWALNCRKRYLAGGIFNHEMDFHYWMERDSEDPVNAEMFVVFAIKEVKKSAKLKKEIRRLDRAMLKTGENTITDEMIDQARQFPIDQLIQFVKGSTVAFCHDDKNPSLTWDKKRNRAKCWPCDKSFDPIAVLMERDGYQFKDAVRELAGRQ